MKQSAYETFVVRIYRRDPVDPGRLSGTVEAAEHGSRASFDSVDTLIAALCENALKAHSRRRPSARTPPLKSG